jgi:hypothetical protein
MLKQSIVFFVVLHLNLFAYDNTFNKCIIENVKAPDWVCYKFKNNTILQAVGISSHKNLSLKIKKKLAVANARVNLAGIVKSKVESSIITKTKINNKNYSKDIISNRTIIAHEKIIRL